MFEVRSSYKQRFEVWGYSVANGCWELDQARKIAVQTGFWLSRLQPPERGKREQRLKGGKANPSQRLPQSFHHPSLSLLVHHHHHFPHASTEEEGGREETGSN
jgi:hypothetical protein